MYYKIEELKKEISKVVVGQDGMVDALLIGLLCDGHVLVEGLPGVAKTTTINAIARALGLDFKRVQFTPDLLPSDIIGAEIYDPKNNSFKIKKGPVFTHLLLADEINRSPAKVQSALLEVMQERQVTIGDSSFKIDEPFFVMATQNPLEQEGVYRLPEAQLDRFMLKTLVGYNNKNDELAVARQVANKTSQTIQSVISFNELSQIKSAIGAVHMDAQIEEYIIELVDATRHPELYGLHELKKYIAFGVSSRVSIDMFKASRAMAFLRKKDFVSPVDIALVAKELMRHRMVLTYEAEADGVDADVVIGRILEGVRVP